jgi:hypothetical protein
MAGSMSRRARRVRCRDLDELAWSAAGQPPGGRRADRRDHTRTGLRVRAELDRGAYPTGVKVSDAELAAVPLTRHAWHGEWNYTVTGSRTRTTAA